jgi:SAM-dependent methyltransferase
VKTVRSGPNPERNDADRLATAAKRVPAAYDSIAAAWHASRARGAEGASKGRPFVDRLVRPLAPASRILDVGCGGGVPIAAYLVRRGFGVTGLDAAARMIALAREAVPGAEFVHGEMRTASFDDVFDAIVAWDSVFHLPRTEHQAVFGRFRAWLRPGGRLLLSLGGSSEEGFTSKMFGETFYYSGHEPAMALRLVEQAGFRVEHWEIDDLASRGHMVVLATAR